MAAVAFGRRLPVLAILPAQARPRGAASAARAVRRDALGIWQFEQLARVDLGGVADLRAVGRIDRRVAGAFSVDLPGDQPQAVAALDHIAAAGVYRGGAGRRERLSDAARNLAVGGQFVDPQFDAAHGLAIGRAEGP